MYYHTEVANANACLLKLKVKSADGTADIDVNVLNSLAEWPSSWGGTLTIGMRDSDDVKFDIADVILDNKVEVPERLFEITGTLDANGVVQPTFNFTNETI